tara:strand:+ start:8963 stop:10531 length:1569 start_codon:yes stop_codon:yes gene_type:complete
MQLNKKISFIILFFALLVIFKMDYRYLNELKCCGDDFDYYSHAYTISVDFDFDYSNQLIANHPETMNFNGKIAPRGFVGSGILASPFLFIGNIFDEILKDSIVSYKIIFYSLSPVFYMLLTLNFLVKSLHDLNKKPNNFLIMLIILGSGLSFYAFERYSMTHVYEAFIVTLIFYIVVKINNDIKKKNLFLSLLPFVLALGFLVRSTNYYIIFLPYLFQKLFFMNKLITQKSSILVGVSSIFSGLFFYFINQSVYGRFLFNPTIMYGESERFKNYIENINSIQSFISYNFNIFKNLIFTQEFGLLWFNPIVLVGFLISLYYLFKRGNTLVGMLLVLSYLQNFAIIGIWRSTASSYGFRYLLSLVPLSIILFYTLENKKVLSNFLFMFSIFGIFSILFFESTAKTELSILPVMNSFGNEILYSNPKYLSGLFLSFFEFNAYLKIGVSSLLGAFVLKLLILLFGKSNLIDLLLENFSQGVNDRLLNYIELMESIQIFQIVLLIIFIILSTTYLINIISFHNVKDR